MDRTTARTAPAGPSTRANPYHQRVFPEATSPPPPQRPLTTGVDKTPLPDPIDPAKHMRSGSRCSRCRRRGSWPRGVLGVMWVVHSKTRRHLFPHDEWGFSAARFRQGPAQGPSALTPLSALTAPVAPFRRCGRQQRPHRPLVGSRGPSREWRPELEPLCGLRPAARARRRGGQSPASRCAPREMLFPLSGQFECDDGARRHGRRERCILDLDARLLRHAAGRVGDIRLG